MKIQPFFLLTFFHFFFGHSEKRVVIKKDLLVPYILAHWTRKEKIHLYATLSNEIKAFVPELTLDKKKMGSLFWHALESSNKDLLSLLLQIGVDPNTRHFWGSIPLSYALRYKKKEIAQLLIEKGANVNEKDRWTKPPLHWAAQRGYVGIMRLLIQKGANPKTQTEDGTTALHFAHNKEVVELLVAHGLPINKKNKSGDTPLDSITFYRKKEAKIYLSSIGGERNKCCLIL